MPDGLPRKQGSDEPATKHFTMRQTGDGRGGSDQAGFRHMGLSPKVDHDEIGPATLCNRPPVR